MTERETEAALAIKELLVYLHDLGMAMGQPLASGRPCERAWAFLRGQPSVAPVTTATGFVDHIATIARLVAEIRKATAAGEHDMMMAGAMSALIGSAIERANDPERLRLVAHRTADAAVLKAGEL